MSIFVKLLLAHLLGDFLLQPTSWVIDKESKKHKSMYLYVHIALHGLLAWLLVGFLDFGWFALFTAISHGFIDFMKLYFQKPETKRNWFVIDQILHLILIFNFLMAIILSVTEKNLSAHSFHLTIIRIIHLMRALEMVLILTLTLVQCCIKEPNLLIQFIMMKPY